MVTARQFQKSAHECFAKLTDLSRGKKSVKLLSISIEGESAVHMYIERLLAYVCSAVASLGSVPVQRRWKALEKSLRFCITEVDRLEKNRLAGKSVKMRESHFISLKKRFRDLIQAIESAGFEVTPDCGMGLEKLIVFEAIWPSKKRKKRRP